MKKHPMPFVKASNVIAPKTKAKDVPDLEEAMDEDDEVVAEEAYSEEVDDENDWKKDKYVMQPKKKSAKKATSAKKDKSDGDDFEDEVKSKKRGRSARSGKKGKK